MTDAIPAKAGILRSADPLGWIPAFAGMTWNRKHEEPWRTSNYPRAARSFAFCCSMRSRAACQSASLKLRSS